jgi:hypothetical protein
MNTAICFKNICTSLNVKCNYVYIKIESRNKRCQKKLSAAFSFRFNQDLRIYSLKY